MSYDNTYRSGNEGATSAILMFSVGALVGAAVALIFAPTTGREARQYLGKRSKELADNVSEQGKKVAETVAEQGRRAWNEHGERVTQAVREGYTHVAEATERAARATDSSNPM